MCSYRAQCCVARMLLPSGCVNLWLGLLQCSQLPSSCARHAEVCVATAAPKQHFAWVAHEHRATCMACIFVASGSLRFPRPVGSKCPKLQDVPGRVPGASKSGLQRHHLFKTCCSCGRKLQNLSHPRQMPVWRTRIELLARHYFLVSSVLGSPARACSITGLLPPVSDSLVRHVCSPHPDKINESPLTLISKKRLPGVKSTPSASASGTLPLLL